MQAGILGLGVHLPEEIRRNDWWPPETVVHWQERLANASAPGGGVVESLPPGARKTLAAIAELRQDPFRGAVERRIMPDGMLSSELESEAARKALEDAGVFPGEIDLILTQSFCPDYHSTANACAVHHRLGLPERCLSVSVEATCNSFLAQLALAEPLIATGRVRHALLVQSNGIRRLTPPEEPFSVLFGDGATAVVVGPVGNDRGILGQAHRTDGASYDALVSSVPGRAWYEEGRICYHVRDPERAQRTNLAAADRGKLVVEEALQQAGAQPEDIGFYASHQATSWFRRVTQEHYGLTHARFADTFAWTGSLGAASIPISLSVGVQQGLLRNDDLVCLFAGGAGLIWSSAVLRWGR
jgi:3-oxoacyl-[acyl-carrier-protein] synthase III